MIAILTEHDLKRVLKLPFCYLCGRPFAAREQKNRDHVPPTAIFNMADRNPPLVLPTHIGCNAANSNYDEQVGQLVSIMHTPPTSKKQVSRLKFEFFRAADSPIPIVGVRIDLSAIVFRWVRGFHAALYGEYLPVVGGYIHLPLPEGDPKTGFAPIQRAYFEFVKTIKKNRLINQTDQVVCRADKCRYECVWAKLDDGREFCMFALDLYDWQQLGDTNHTLARSCVGYYTPPHVPMNASRETKIEFPFLNTRPLDAFAD